MQWIYQNWYSNYTLRELYRLYQDKTYNYPKKFDDVIVVWPDKAKTYQCNFAPIEYLIRPQITRYNNESDFNTKSSWTVMIEWTDYTIDYELWIVYFIGSLTVWWYIEIIWEWNKINIRQFVSYLNSWLRVLHKYYPYKFFYTYSPDWDGKEVSIIDTTWLPFVDVNAIYTEISAIKPLNMWRRAQYLILEEKKVEYKTDFGYNTLESVKPKTPLYIEWNAKPDYVQWLEDDEELFSKTVRLSEHAIEALLLYIGICCYQWMLHLNQEIRSSSVKMNDQSLYALIRELKSDLAARVWDSALSKWFYPATFVKNLDMNLWNNA